MSGKTAGIHYYIGRVLKQRRECINKNPWTLEYVATRASLSVTQVWNIERGRGSIDAVERVCLALGIKLSEAVLRAEKMMHATRLKQLAKVKGEKTWHEGKQRENLSQCARSVKSLQTAKF